MQTDYLKVKPLIQKILNEVKSAAVICVLVGDGCPHIARCENFSGSDLAPKSTSGLSHFWYSSFPLQDSLDQARENAEGRPALDKNWLRARSDSDFLTYGVRVQKLYKR